MTHQFRDRTASDVLAQDFMTPNRLAPQDVAHAIGVPTALIEDVLAGRAAFTPDLDLRLTRYFTLLNGFFIHWQIDCELLTRKRAIARELAGILPHGLEPTSAQVRAKEQGAGAPPPSSDQDGKFKLRPEYTFPEGDSAKRWFRAGVALAEAEARQRALNSAGETPEEAFRRSLAYLPDGSKL